MYHFLKNNWLKLSIIVFILIIGFVMVLITRDKNSKNEKVQEVQHFCEVMCIYNSDKYVWEFNSENAGFRSFPTKDECFVFCKTYKKDYNL